MVVQERLIGSKKRITIRRMSLIAQAASPACCLYFLTQRDMETGRLTRRLIPIELFRVPGWSRMRQGLLLFATSRTQDEEKRVSHLPSSSPADSSLFFPSPG